MPPSIPADGARPVPPSTPPGLQNGHEVPLPSSPSSAAAVGLSRRADLQSPPGSSRTRKFPASNLIPPASAQNLQEEGKLICLELEDGTAYQGYSFSAEKSVAGELVFQTGMVGYTESITDPSYRGQILVITFPLVGNYGVPSRESMDELLHDLPKYFESAEIHIVGLVTASYSGEDFSHYLAESSLGKWLKEQGVPAMHGVDTRALTKRIRKEGSMLGRMLLQKPKKTDSLVNGHPTSNGEVIGLQKSRWRDDYESTEWIDPNTMNLVDHGEEIPPQNSGTLPCL